MKATAFRDPAGASSSVAVLIETPGMETLEKELAESGAVAGLAECVT